MKKPAKTIGFQLDAQHYQRLEKLGRRYSLSAGQYAREIIIRALDSNEEGIIDALNLLAQKLDDIHGDVKGTKNDLQKDNGLILKLLYKENPK